MPTRGEQAQTELRRRAAQAELDRRNAPAFPGGGGGEFRGSGTTGDWAPETLGEKIVGFEDQLIGAGAKGFMRVGRAALGAPATAVKQAGLIRQWSWAEDVLHEKDPKRQAELRKGMAASEESFNKVAKALGEAQDWHQQGVQTILANHPEWESEPPESFIDLVKNPSKLAVCLAEATPLLISAGILTAAGQPQVAAGLMYVSEGQEASDQAIADGASEEDAAIAYSVYGTVAAALETMQLQGLIKVAKGSYNALLNRTVQKVAKSGLRTAAMGTIKVAATEALEEMAQGAWGEMTAKMVYDKDVPDGVAGFIDRRAQEAYIGGVMGLVAGGAGGVAGRVQGGQTAKAGQMQIGDTIIGEAVAVGEDFVQMPEGVFESKELADDIRVQAETVGVTPEHIVGSIQLEQEAAKTVSRFPQKITDQASLANIGEAMKVYMGLEDWDVEWGLHDLATTRILGWSQVKHSPVKAAGIRGKVIISVAKPTGKKLIGLKKPKPTQAGGRVMKPGFAFDIHSQAHVKRTLVHELGHIARIAYYDVKTHKWHDHTPEFAAWVEEKVKQLFAKKPSKAKPISEADVPQQIGGIEETEPAQLPFVTSEAPVMEAGKPKTITRRKALKLGHTLPDLLEWDETRRRNFMQQTVGQTTMKGMKLTDMRTLVEALQGEVRAAGLEYTAPTPPVDELVETLQAKKVTELEPAEELKAGKVRKLARQVKAGAHSFVTGLERMERFFESLDGHKKGTFSENIWKPVQQADELSTEFANQDLDEFMGALEDQGIDTALWLGKMEQISDTRWGLTPFQKIGTYMLAQNKTGKRQLIKGMGMSESDLAQIIEAMTPQETATAEWLLEKYDQQWDVIKAVAVQSGIDPAKLKKELRYSPIMRTDADLETQEDFLSGIIEGFTNEGYDPEHKFLEERKKGAAGKVELDAAILYMHNIARTQRFIQFAPVAHKMGKILNSKKFKRALNDRTYGQGSKLINKWMKDSVRGTTAQTTTGLSKIANIMRRNGIVYAIGFNIPSSLRQSLSLSNAVAVDKAMLVHVPANLTRATTPKGYKEMEEFVFSRSLQVKNSSFDRDLRTKANKAGLKLRLRGKQQWSQRAISWIRWMDRHTRVVAWKSLYDTGMGKFNDETKASEYADKWVARTQPMANMKDLPHFFRGGTFEKLLTTFQNQVNNNANFYMYDILGAKKTGEISNTEAAHRVMFSYVLPAVLFGMIGRGGPPKDIKDIAVDLATYPLAGVVVIGRWITRMIRGWGDSSTIAEAAPGEAAKLVGAVKRGDIKDIIKFAASTVGAATGRIPAQGIRTAEGALDLASGETEDPRRLIYSEWALKQGEKKKRKSKYGGGYRR